MALVLYAWKIWIVPDWSFLFLYAIVGESWPNKNDQPKWPRSVARLSVCCIIQQTFSFIHQSRTVVWVSKTFQFISERKMLLQKRLQTIV